MSDQLKPGDIRWFYTYHTVHVCRLIELVDVHDAGRVFSVWIVAIIRDDGTWSGGGYALRPSEFFLSREQAYEAGKTHRRNMHDIALANVNDEQRRAMESFVVNANRDAEREEAALAAMNKNGGE